MEKARILVVADESIIALDLKHRLESLGYIVPAPARSGEEALRRVEASPPDLVLIDLNLQGAVNGIEAAEKILCRFRLPVIFLTAYADEETLRRAKVTGTYESIFKPHDERELHNNLEIALYKHQVEQQARKREELFRQLTESIDDAFWLYDLILEKMIYVSPAYARVTGYAGNNLLQRPGFWLEVVDPADQERIAAAFRDHLHGKKQFDEEYRVLQPEGSVRWNRTHASWIRNDRGEVYRVAGVTKDITEGKAVEARLIHRILHDNLTGLPNRTLFMDRLGHAVERLKRHSDSLVAVLFLDLDGFKGINDTLGHAAGDRFLVEIARRLESCLRPTDTVARCGGDEFAILVEDIRHTGEAEQVAERIQAELSLPFELKGQVVSTSASIGISLAHSEKDPPEDLLHNADTAMYRAKAKGKKRYEIYLA